MCVSRCLGAAGIDGSSSESFLAVPPAVEGIIDKELLVTGIRYASMAYFGHLALMMLMVYLKFDGQVGAEAGERSVDFSPLAVAMCVVV